MKTLATRFDTLASRWGDRPALICGEQQLSYRQWRQASHTLANELQKRGQKQENIGLLLPNVPSFGIGFFATQLSGNTLVPINFLLQPTEIARIVEHSGMRLILTDEPMSEKVREIAGHISQQLEVLEISKVLADAECNREVVPPEDPESTAVLIYTSGTTGQPKGVMLTHKNLISNVDAYLEVFEFRADDHFIGVLPLFHSFGITVNLLGALWEGSPHYLIPKFQPRPVLDLLRDLPGAILTAVPPMLNMLARLPGEEKLENIRAVVSGGAGLPAKVQEAFFQRFGVEIVQGYGLTEASPVVCSNKPGFNRPGTIGRPLPGNEVEIWDDQGSQLPPNEPGELVTRGPHVMAGYYRNPEVTREAVTVKGWLRTGDMATMDEDGFVRIVGRKKELIISAGMNIYPLEIEEVLTGHPGVLESAVVPMEDPLRGEVPAAFVVPNEGQSLNPAHLRQLCREHLAEYKIPKKIVVTTELPRTPTGKIKKNALVELLKLEN